MSRFGFAVRYYEAEDDWPAGWEVELPHQCDEWKIAPEDRYGPPASRDEGIASLEAFIGEAQAALVALRRGEEFPPAQLSGGS